MPIYLNLDKLDANPTNHLDLAQSQIFGRGDAQMSKPVAVALPKKKSTRIVLCEHKDS